MQEPNAVTALRVEVALLRAEVKEMHTATQDLVDAWRAATKLLIFVKWVAAIAAAITTLWVSIKGLFHV